MEKTILKTENLTKSFGGLKAVDNVTLTVKENSITGLIGPNGSGKTTLFNTISGVYKPERGKIYFNGERIDGLAPYKIYEKGLARTFQTPRLFQKLTVLDNMMVSCRSHPGDKILNVFLKKRRWSEEEEKLAEKALEILEIIELDRFKDKPASELSGGQMKLLELGRVLMTEPKMLLLDEPAAGVNPTLARRIFEKITQLRDELSLTFFTIEHRIEILLEHADWVYVMHNGSIIAESPPEEVVKNKVVVDVYLGEA
ncbi:MAG: ABC transporter ATP-binding protein [Candidatus Hecatellales archaeon]|nr:MAG: ABC transporter ATP-binding protein [Candidatus Hecatellales archaeon]